jgi:hypothetical protein
MFIQYRFPILSLKSRRQPDESICTRIFNGNMNMNSEVKKEATLMQTLRAVLWSFLGIRSKEGFDSDTSQLSLMKVIIVGIIGAALFVLSLLLLVHFVTR